MKLFSIFFIFLNAANGIAVHRDDQSAVDAAKIRKRRYGCFGTALRIRPICSIDTNLDCPSEMEVSGSQSAKSNYFSQTDRIPRPGNSVFINEVPLDRNAWTKYNFYDKSNDFPKTFKTQTVIGVEINDACPSEDTVYDVQVAMAKDGQTEGDILQSNAGFPCGTSPQINSPFQGGPITVYCKGFTAIENVAQIWVRKRIVRSPSSGWPGFGNAWNSYAGFAPGTNPFNIGWWKNPLRNPFQNVNEVRFFG